MTRTAILPTTGDPYCCAAFLECYKRYWKNEVDSLRVFINCEMSNDLLVYVVDLFEQVGAIVQYVPYRTGHGLPLDTLVKEATEDYIYITEDDFFISHTGLVDSWFKIIESGQADAIGSKRGCTTAEICQLEASKFHLSGPEVQQPNFWPCLYLGTRESLQAIEWGCGPRTWRAGELIKGLDYVTPVDVSGDTFVSASIELRAQGLRVYPIDNNRIIDVYNARNLHPEWVHVGSYANAIMDLTNENQVALGALGDQGIQKENSRTQTYPVIPDVGILALFEERAVFWQLFRDRFPIPEKFSASWLNQKWTEAIDRYIVMGNLRPSGIANKKAYLESILGPLWS